MTNCNKNCIWYQVYSNPIRIACDYKDKLIKDIPKEEREDCKNYKTKDDVKKGLKF